MAFSTARAIRFLAIGGFSTAVYWLVLLTLTGILHVNAIAASVTAYAIGFFVAYIGHRSITYRSSAFMGPELTRFLTIQGFCFVTGNLAFWLAVSKFGFPVMAGGAVLTAVNVGAAFVAYEAWVFRPQN